MELQTIDIKDLIKLMDENPDDFIVTVDLTDDGGAGDVREEHI